MPEKVAVVSVISENVSAAIRKAVDLIGGLEIESTDHVVIKPNLCDLAPADRGATTDVRIVEGVVQILKEVAPNCVITVVESNSQGRTAEEAFARLGFIGLKRKYNVELVNLGKDRLVNVGKLSGVPSKEVMFPHALLFCEYFVSIAKLKTHVFERMTGILKNQFGLIPERDKSIYHPYLSQFLLALNSIAKPNLCIVDGIVAMEGRGPTAGEPKRTNLIIVGKNPIAVDFVACLIMGIKPRSVPHLKPAIKHQTDILDNVKIVGESLEKVAMKFRLPRRSEFLLHRLDFRLRRFGLTRLGEFTSRVAGFFRRSKNGFLKTIIRGFIKIIKSVR